MKSDETIKKQLAAWEGEKSRCRRDQRCSGGGVRGGGHRAPRHLARRLKQPPQRPLEAPLNLDVNIFQMKTRPDKVKQMQAPAVVLW